MNFLSNLAIPESGERLTLLRYLLVVATIFFATYASIVSVASTFSAVFDWGARKSGIKHYHRFAADLADLAAPNKGIIYSLAVVPLMAIILIYAQLLYGMNLGITSYLVCSAVFFLLGFYVFYGYKRSLHLSPILTAFQRLAGSQGSEAQPDLIKDVESFDYSATKTLKRGGRRSAILFWTGTWFFVGATRLAFTPRQWSDSSLVTILFSNETLCGLLGYVVTALIITSAAVLFFFFKWEGGIARFADDSYSTFVKKRTLPVGLVAAVLEPMLILFEIRNLPQVGLSNLTFVVGCVGMFTALLLVFLFYSMLRDSRINLGSYAFACVVVLVLVWTAKDEIAFRYATRNQTEVLGQRYESMLASLNPGTAQPIISGEEIYDGRCSACHRFDIKLVGPPYNQTLPHFVGKIDSLEDFIMDPRQVVPGYPPMPKQGLKPAEVKAVAEYIMGIYLKSHPQATLADTTKKKI
jgi:mono/diheme cytochrome c family protein